jgi:cytosine/adenosine deaminase-related metal-dependent hydrolase/ubiquinone/menaquinone biosynthesis C-methylase UbiE
MSRATAATCLSAADGYRLWANSYDREANPLLSLEQRIGESLLPSVAGLDVVDLGCGTGRWLNTLRDAGARSLTGVDLSPEMLGYAQRKLGDRANFHCADYRNAPHAPASADLVLCNFALSYVDEPLELLKFARTILRSGGWLLLSDLHPDTAARLRWRRGIPGQKEFQEIHTYPATMAGVIALCDQAGFAPCAHVEPRFGAPERTIFEEHGKGEYFETIREYPAIYVLQLAASRKLEHSQISAARQVETLSFCGSRFALGPTDSIHGEMEIRNSKVESLRETGSETWRKAQEQGPVIDLRGYLALPGLINAHDHLDFALYPRLGKGSYKNFLEWAEDIHRSHASEIADHRRMPKSVRLWWGGIRNLLCGVTSVCHHNPFAPETFSKNFAVRVLGRYGWAHSLPLEPNAGRKRKETPNGWPFLIHLAEGTDEGSAKEIFQLDQAGALDADTVIIHGLGLDEKGRALLRAAQAGLVWCPSSNRFLFGEVLLPEEIRLLPKVALGSDSPLTAQGDLLDEVRFAHEELQTPTGELYRYVTRGAASLLGMKEGEGTLRVGGVADLTVVRDSGLSPADTLATLTFREVELVILGGRVQLVSEEIRRRLPANLCTGLEPISVEGIIRWIRAPLHWMFRKTSALLSGSIYLGGKRVSLGR